MSHNPNDVMLGKLIGAAERLVDNCSTANVHNDKGRPSGESVIQGPCARECYDTLRRLVEEFREANPAVIRERALLEQPNQL